MSQHEYWAGYNARKNEAGADAYGIIMNIAVHGAVTSYAQSLMNIRGLSLLGDDPNHYTYPAIGKVLRMEPEKLMQRDAQQRFRLATEIRDQTVGSYDDYVRFMVAAVHVSQQLGGAVVKNDFTQETLDRDLMRTLIMDTHSAYRNLTGREFRPVK